MFKLVHLSDIHLGPLPEPSWRQLASKRVLGYLNWKKNRKHALKGNYLQGLIEHIPDLRPDHIIVSGDLVNLALPDEFPMAKKFLDTLGSAKNVTAICGNHDAYVQAGLPNAIRHWHDNMCGDETGLDNAKDYPVLRKRGNVAIIACNSAEPTAPFMATGYFRQDQAERLARILVDTQDMCRVVSIHHPPFPNATHWHKRLIGDKLFLEVIRSHGAELVLHGHTHLATSVTIEGKDAQVPVVCVPAAGNAPGGKKPAGRANLFNIECDRGRFNILHEAYQYSPEDNCLELVVSQQL
ncbi:MAG: metallophosphoesterase [Pseudomonadota bacterium]